MANYPATRSSGPLEPVKQGLTAFGWLGLSWIVLFLWVGFLAASVALAAGVVGGRQLQKAISRA